MEIEVKIRALMMDPNSGTPIIILKDVQSDTMLPIWVGAYEANAIALEIEKRSSDRNLMRLDSRPSDAIALALRADCQIFVDMEVIKASRNTIPAEESDETELTQSEEEWPDVIGEAGDLPM